MHAIVRTYSGKGAKKIFDELEARKEDVKTLISKVPGFVSFMLMRSDDGGFSVTVCRDKAGTDESRKVAREWIKQNIPSVASAPPAVAEGTVILHVK